MKAIRLDAQRLRSVLDDLLEQEPELPYANFQPIAQRAGAAAHLHRELWLKPSRSQVWGVFASNGKPLAALRAEHREFESEHFGFEAAKIDQPIAVRDAGLRLEALRTLYPPLLEALGSSRYSHVAARASTRDRCTAWVLQDNGFHHVDTQVSWMCALTGTPHDDALPPNLRFEIHDRRSVTEIERRHWQKLAEWAGTAFDRGPFVFDLTVPYDRACQIYQMWTEKMMTGQWADAIVLVRRDDEVVAYISMLEMPELSTAAGVRVFGRGLGATLPDYRGLFTAIQREMITRRPLDADFMENETQVATIGSINVYAKLGFRYLRSTSTFHRRL